MQIAGRCKCSFSFFFFLFFLRRSPFLFFLSLFIPIALFETGIPLIFIRNGQGIQQICVIYTRESRLPKSFLMNGRRNWESVADEVRLKGVQLQVSNVGFEYISNVKRLQRMNFRSCFETLIQMVLATFREKGS